MITLLTIIHVIVCLFIIIVVLLQSGKGQDIAAAFGGGLGSQTAFGPRGTATLLSKVTTWAAVIFMCTSITLSIFAARRTSGGSVLSGTKAAPTQTAPTEKPTAPPATPGQPAPTNPATPQQR